MTGVSGKKVEGILQEINPTTIQIEGKMIYLPRLKRDEVNALRLIVGERVFCVYSISGDLISIDRRTSIIDAEKEQKLHIQQEQAGPFGEEPHEGERAEGPNEVGMENLHIQHESVVGEPEGAEVRSLSHQVQEVYHHNKEYIQVPTKNWISERERHETILLQSVLARAVEIVNANYTGFPPWVSKASARDKETFVEILDARCNLIERTTERLYDFVKKKARTKVIEK